MIYKFTHGYSVNRVPLGYGVLDKTIGKKVYGYVNTVKINTMNGKR